MKRSESTSIAPLYHLLARQKLNYLPVRRSPQVRLSSAPVGILGVTRFSAHLKALSWVFLRLLAVSRKNTPPIGRN